MSDPARYIFDDAESRRELERLRAIEAVFDPRTRQHLESTGDWRGHTCLEVGAGAGSIAAWMAARVGPAGRVTAVDTNARFLGSLDSAVRVVEADVREADLGSAGFDLAHARYVLIHNADAGAVLDALVRSLKPGGWLLLEEPDFAAACALAAPQASKRAFEHVSAAIHATFSARGMDHSLGRRLPSLLRERGLTLVEIENDAPVQRGGSPIAKLMSLSADQLREKYVATGLATENDVSLYQGFAADPSCWAVYYSTVRVLARCPG